MLIGGLGMATALGSPAVAKVTLVEEGPFRWTLGGYARMLGGVQVPNVDDAFPDIPLIERPTTSALTGAVLRLEWGFKWGDVVALEIHNRFALSGSSATLGSSSEPSDETAGGGVGLGTTRAPQRALDTNSVIFQDEVFRLDHDLDRLVLRLFLGPVDLSLGRQGITWGNSSLFTVADVWASFSPFDLDTSQKRGIDAVRANINLGDAELDVIVADRGTVNDLSGGVRATFYTGPADVYVGLGKFWQDIGLMAGISVPIDAFKVRLEAMAAYALDEKSFRLPTITAGLDWLATAELTFALELHYNGLGTDASSEYLATTQSTVVARGQTYLLGRYYAGLLVGWQAHELIQLGVSAMMNLTDPSGLVTWNLSYSVAQDVDLGLGGFHGIGAGLNADLQTGAITFSELGAYGHTVYLQLAAFF